MPRERPYRPFARVAAACLVLVALGCVLAGRALVDGEREVGRADEALRQHDMPAAINHARAAAAWYLPGAPHVTAGYERLLHVARTSEALGDKPTALLAWRALRSAALSTRWLVQPHAGELALADDAIVRLSAELTPPSLAAAEEHSPGQAAARARAELAEGERVRGPWVAVLAAGLSAVFGAAVWGARRVLAVGPHETLVRALRAPAALGALGLVVYAVAIYFS